MTNTKLDVKEKLKNLREQNTGKAAEFDLIDKEFELIAKAIELRKAQGVTQSDIEAKTGITQQTISKIEKLSINPSLRNFIKYLDAAGLEIEIQKKSQKSNEENLVTA